jgi:hypothetical protein
LGDEGRGSLLSLLKEKNLAHALTTSLYNPARSFGMLELKVELTEEGLEKTDDILEFVFQVRNPCFPYTELISSAHLSSITIPVHRNAKRSWPSKVALGRAEGIAPAQLSLPRKTTSSLVCEHAEREFGCELNYFTMKMLLLSTVLSFVLAFQQFPIEHCLVGDFLMTDYKPELISEYLNHLTPQNLRHMDLICVCILLLDICIVL